MYCAICKELMAGEELLKNEEGYNFPYYEQVCEICHPERTMKTADLEKLLEEKKNEQKNHK